MINNAVFQKTIENVRKNSNIKLVTTESESNYLVPGPNYQTTTFFRNCISHRNEKKKIFMNKPINCSLSIWEISKNCNSMKLKYEEKTKSC